MNGQADTINQAQTTTPIPTQGTPSYAAPIQATPTYWMPIVKAEPQNDGRLKVIGLATEESFDEEGDVVDASRNPRCLRFINEGRAVFDYNHHSDKGGPIVGRPTFGKFLSNAEARAKYPGFDIKGQAIEIEGYVNALGSRPPKDLDILHHYAEVGERLGFSIKAPRAGTYYDRRDGKRVPVAIPGTIYKVAIAEQPINGNTPCFIVKSLAAALEMPEADEQAPDVELEAAEWNEQSPRLIVVGGDVALIKALTSSGQIATAGTGRGDSLKIQDLQKQPGNADLTGDGATDDEDNRNCLKCHCKIGKGKKHCGDCGELYKALPVLLEELGNLLGGKVRTQ